MAAATHLSPRVCDSESSEWVVRNHGLGSVFLTTVCQRPIRPMVRLSFKGFAGDPIEQECVYLRAHDLHEIAGETVASRCVNVKHSYAGIKTQSGSGQPGFRF